MSYKQHIKAVWRGEEVKIKGNKVINKSAFEVGLVVEGQAKLLTPIKTGRLAASITTQARLMGTKPHGTGAVFTDVIGSPRDDMMIFVGTPVEYGPYVEFGTNGDEETGIGGMEAQAFLRPALALAKGQTLTILLDNGRAQFKEFIRPVGAA